jgi:hypothetical protein
MKTWHKVAYFVGSLTFISAALYAFAGIALWSHLDPNDEGRKSVLVSIHALALLSAFFAFMDGSLSGVNE